MYNAGLTAKYCISKSEMSVQTYKAIQFANSVSNGEYYHSLKQSFNSLRFQHEPYSPTLSLLPLCIQNNSSTWHDHTTRAQNYKRCAYWRSLPQPLPTQTSTGLPDNLLLNQVFIYCVLKPSGRSTTQCRLWSESQQYSVRRPTALWGEIRQFCMYSYFW